MGAVSFEGIVDTVSGMVWGWPLICLILAAGVYLTVRARFIQARRLGTALRCVFAKDGAGKGEISSFGALCTSLAATIGTGNIVGVATAITAGGPGALLWMLLAAFFGMATKYAEGLLAVKYRVETRPGHFLGGPFCYIERGLGRRYARLAKAFAFFGSAAGIMGIGTMTQINSMTSAVNSIADPEARSVAFSIGGSGYTWAAVISGAVFTAAAALVMIGGIKRIAKACSMIVPFMAGTYVLFSAIILTTHAEAIPEAVATVFISAFKPSAVGGAISGLTLRSVIRMGVGRGIFSNEAGLGSAPIAAAGAKTNDPARQGLVTMTGTFFDTIIVCSMTGLSIVITGAWDMRVTGKALKGVEVTMFAWRKGLPFDKAFSSVMLTLCLVFFAFTTILGWSFYGERCLEYLTGGRRKAVRAYRLMYILAVLIGPYMTASAVWGIADIFNGLMALPNLIALFLLGSVVSKESAAAARTKRSVRIMRRKRRENEIAAQNKKI